MQTTMSEPSSPIRRAAAARGAAGTAGPWLLAALVALGAGVALAATGRFQWAGVTVLIAAPALLFAASAGRVKSRFAAYAAAVADAVGDSAPIGALAWPLRNGSTRIGVAAVAALGLVFLGAYSSVKATALGFPTAAVKIAAPERCFVLGVGLVIPAQGVLEAALWLIAVSALFAAGSTTMSVWKRSE
ncbi:MAG: hypothetical protein NVSMB57_03850 [Actinomycetota bacterium]